MRVKEVKMMYRLGNRFKPVNVTEVNKGKVGEEINTLEVVTIGLAKLIP